MWKLTTHRCCQVTRLISVTSQGFVSMTSRKPIVPKLLSNKWPEIRQAGKHRWRWDSNQGRMMETLFAGTPAKHHVQSQTSQNKTLLDWLLQFVSGIKKSYNQIWVQNVALRYGFEKLGRAEILLQCFHNLLPRESPLWPGLSRWQ